MYHTLSTSIQAERKRYCLNSSSYNEEMNQHMGMEGKGRGKEKDMGKKGKKQISRLYPIFLILIRIFSYCFPEINIENNNTGGWEGSALYDQVCC